MYVLYIHMCGYSHMDEDAHIDPKSQLDPLELELLAGSCGWQLGTKLQSSERAAHTLWD